MKNYFNHLNTPPFHRHLCIALLSLAGLLQACGGGGGAGSAAQPDTAPKTAGPITQLAGKLGGSGNADDVGTAARLNQPSGIAKDAAGHFYIADRANSLLRKITPSGEVSTLAGQRGVSGTADGQGAAAQFRNLESVVVNAFGTAYVADTLNHTIRKVTPAGLVSTFAGLAGSRGGVDGSGTSATFNNPTALALDSLGNIYVAESSGHTIRKITPAGAVSTFAGSTTQAGFLDAQGTAARFNGPVGLVFDEADNLYVAEGGNHTIRKIDTLGNVTTIAGSTTLSGFADGQGTNARFNRPRGMSFDANGNLYVADSSNHVIRKIDTSLQVTTVAGSPTASGFADGQGNAARFFNPYGVIVDGTGQIMVTDYTNHAIRRVTPAGDVSTYAGAAVAIGSSDGNGSAASFRYATGMTSDVAGNVYIADTNNHTIRKVTPSGDVSTLAGSAQQTGTADGTGAAARFNVPTALAVDTAGNLLVADRLNHMIRSISPAGVVTTLAGVSNQPGNTDGSLAQARFFDPYGITTDRAGNIYVANTSGHTIRKITPAGVVSTLAGSATFQGSADGSASNALFKSPRGVAVDQTGNVYVTDSNNSTIRKITPAGQVSTLAGLAGQIGYADGTGSAARFDFPDKITIDAAGNLYVGDYSTIRKITPAGVVSTLAGVANVFGAKANIALPGRINYVNSISWSPAGGSGGTLSWMAENTVMQVRLP